MGARNMVLGVIWGGGGIQKTPGNTGLENNAELSLTSRTSDLKNDRNSWIIHFITTVSFLLLFGCIGYTLK